MRAIFIVFVELQQDLCAYPLWSSTGMWGLVLSPLIERVKLSAQQSTIIVLYQSREESTSSWRIKHYTNKKLVGTHGWRVTKKTGEHLYVQPDLYLLDWADVGFLFHGLIVEKFNYCIAKRLVDSGKYLWLSIEAYCKSGFGWVKSDGLGSDMMEHEERRIEGWGELQMLVYSGRTLTFTKSIK